MALGSLCADMGIDFAERARKIAPWVDAKRKPAPPPRHRPF